MLSPNGKHSSMLGSLKKKNYSSIDMIDWLSISFGVKSFSDKTVLFIALLLQASSGQIYLLLTRWLLPNVNLSG